VKNIFICGESYIGYTVHIKGADTMATSGYFENVGWLRAALEAAGYHVDYMPSHVALEAFPDTAEKLDRYDLVILSDVGANTLMMTKKSFRESLPAPDRCKALRAYVERGGALVMVGGFMSFTGIEGKARYGVTPIADVLPVRLLPTDDRVETSEGSVPVILRKEHPIFQGLPDPWPHYFIGYNRTIADAEKGGRVCNVTMELPKSFVVCVDRDGTETVYISQISSATLLKRAGFVEGLSNV